MNTKTMLRLASLTAAVTAGLLLISGPASAADPDETAPQAVGAWFAGSAPQTAADVLANKATVAHAQGDPTNPAAAGYSAGVPRRLHTWGPGVLADSSASVTTATNEWVAALYLRGRVIGTIAAVEDATGAVRFSYLDDDAAAGTALAAGPAGKVVRDPQLGGLAAVTADGTATGLSTYTANALGKARDRDGLRAAVRQAKDRNSWDTSDSGGSSPAESTDSVWPGVALIAVTGVIVVAFIGRRSRASGRPSTR